jgi:sugar lactone lactonase YvrE
MTRRRIKPTRWTPPTAPADAGRTSATAPLVITRRLGTGGHGPEDVVFDAQGDVVTGLRDGSIVRLDPTTGARTVLANTGGRPLGLEAGADGSVLVCDHDRGLLRVRPDGGVELLVDSVDGQPLTFASNVVQSPEGTIWFTTSTSRWDLDQYEGDMLEHSCTGRLVSLDTDGTVTTLVRGLAFGNGLVLAPDASHLLFAETGRYRVSRHWLTGSRAGTTDVLIDSLPGFPDNMSLGSDGLLWVSLPAPRNTLLDRLLPLPGFLRMLVWNLPAALRPKPAPIAWVMAFDLDGRVVHDLRSDKASYGFVTSVAERDGLVVIGSLHEDDVALVDKPATPGES